MNITIIGTGSVAFGTAALLDRNGNDLTLVSISECGEPHGRKSQITSTGAISHLFQTQVTKASVGSISEADGIIIATSADRYKRSIDAVVPFIRDGQHILFSGELSLASHYLSDQLALKGVQALVTALSTTLVTGRRSHDASVSVGIVRKSSPAFTRPSSHQSEEILFWNSLIGDVLTEATHPLFITFSNLNPVIHVPNALCNFTRIEKGEDWGNYDGITDGVSSLIEQLDDERVMVAKEFGLEIKSIKTTFHQNFGFPIFMTLSDMTAELHSRREGLPKGPTSTDTRYITEDVPFGLTIIEHLAASRYKKTPMHTSAITVLSAMYRRDFRSENPFLTTIDWFASDS